MPALQSIEPSCQWIHACHWDRSLASGFAFQTISVDFGVLVGIQIGLYCHQPWRHQFCSNIHLCWSSRVYCLSSVFLCLD
jgi:hypothetical protein